MDSSSGLMRLRLWLLRGLFAVACVVAQPAFGFGMVGPTDNPIYYCSGGGVSATKGSSPAVACEAHGGKVIPTLDTSASCGFSGATRPLTYAVGLVSDAYYIMKTSGKCSDGSSQGSPAAPFLVLSPSYGGVERGCPENSAAIGSQGTSCECALNFKPEGGKCSRYDCPAKGSYSSQVTPDVKLGGAGDGFCSQGCSVTPSSWKVDAEGQVWGVWPMKSEHKACGGKKDPSGVTTGDDKPQPAPVACSANQCPGNVNGVDVCVPCRSQSTNGPSSAASGVQPSDPKDVLDEDKNIAGTSVRTDCTGVLCTTTYTYVNSKGEKIGERIETEDSDQYCQKNPTANQCKKDSFGGACDAGFQCDGDPVQCALTKEVYQRNCQWFKEPSEAVMDAGSRALTGGDQPDWHPAKNAVETSMGLGEKLDFTDRLGGGCPVDTTFVVIGQTVAIPWSQYCGSMQMAGNAAVAVTLLICLFIVFKE